MSDPTNPPTQANIESSTQTQLDDKKGITMRETTPIFEEMSAHFFYFIYVLIVWFLFPWICAWDKIQPKAFYFIVLSLFSSPILYLLFLLIRYFSQWLRHIVFHSVKLSFSQIWKGTSAGLVQFETLGWIVFLVGIIAANTSVINRLSPPGNSKDLKYFDLLNWAAPDAARTAVIAIIVLFFAQILKSYQASAETTKAAAAESNKAANQAQEVAGQLSRTAASLVPQVKEESDHALDVLKAAISHVGITATTHDIQTFLQKINEAPVMPLFSGLSGAIEFYIRRLQQELYSHKDPEFLFELTAFAALYESYLETEKLTFTDWDDTGQRVAYGNGSCKFVTRFVHYALAVRAVVENLHKLGELETFDQAGKRENRYRFYTILNRSPEQFFNIEIMGRADKDWSDFLWYCLKHEELGIRYQRYFLVNISQDNNDKILNDKDAQPIPELNDVKASLKKEILCDTRGVPVLWSNKLLDAVPLYENILDKNQENMIRRYVEERQFSNLPFLYVIRDESQSSELKQSLIQAGLTWEKIEDVLPIFHNSKTPPRLLCFDNYQKYNVFFGDNVPRDFFAVWDTKASPKADWCLFMGTEPNYGNRAAVRLVFLTNARSKHEHLDWSTIKTKLSLLFCKGQEELKDQGITRRDLQLGEVSE